MARRRRNAPLKGARAIGSNMTEVEHGDLTVLFSYQTPVAFLSPNGGYVTDKHWSVTTSKHIAKFFSMHGYDRKGAFRIPQDDLERFVEKGALDSFPVNLDPTPAEMQDVVRRLTRRRGNPAGKFLWTEKDIGSYADEANGHEHRRAVIAGLLNEVFSGPATVEEQEQIPDLIEELEDEPSDDFGEEDDALDILNRYSDGVYWIVDQDLLLEPDAEEGRN